MMKNILLNLKFNLSDKKINTVQLRGVLASKNKEYFTLHNHLSQNEYLYSYPKVQYKKIKNNYYILGIGHENITILKKVLDNVRFLNIENNQYDILSKRGFTYFQPFGVVDRMVEYTFITPWVCLNEKNYNTFKQLTTDEEKKALIDKILTGNIISIAKRFNYTIKEKLIVDSQIDIYPKKIKIKNIPFLAFKKGSFRVNFEIPDYWGIGKFVSIGYGTVLKEDSMEVLDIVTFE